MTAEQKMDRIMQCGLQFRFFNKPVQDDYLWDIKVFWEHVDVSISEGFDNAIDCLDDCLDYVECYKNPETDYGNKK